MAYSSIPED